MSSPSVDARNAEERKSIEQPSSKHHSGFLHESTAEGDIVVVQPSFDDHDGRSPGTEMKSSEGEIRSPPTTDQQGRTARHTRNLSEHFQDATSLSSEPPSYSGASLSVTVGQKHSRGYSGDGSDPAHAHRRINSIGNSTAVQRRRPHRRIDSSGLDALTAAADFSREELAVAAGSRTPWEPPVAVRRSPIEVASYDHGRTGHVTPGPPPMQPTLAHHQHYLPGHPPPTGYYGPSPYHQSSYPPPHFYPHPSHGYPRQHAPPPPPGGYPVQYSRGQDSYAKQHMAMQQPILERPRVDGHMRRDSPTVTGIDHINANTAMSSALNERMSPPPAPAHWRGASTQGVQTYVTAIGVGGTGRMMEANPHQRMIEANPHQVPASSTDGRSNTAAPGHHRKMSSFSMLFSGLTGPEPTEHPLKKSGAHHRSTSSTVSFLTGLDLDNTDATFLRNLQASAGAPAATLPSTAAKAEAIKLSSIDQQSNAQDGSSDDENGDSQLASGGSSKRVRRKCTVGNCQNRVVQGGLCIAHGAKRKQCKHPGCTKHVKKAGLCSTHGPARKRCDAGSCNKVAVQGGRCIAHGAKKKLCRVEQCAKQAILGGMCKKHHDQEQQDFTGPRAGVEPMVCKIVDSKPDTTGSSKSSGKVKPGHTRGLSIFQEFSVDAVGDLLSCDAAAAAAAASAESLSASSRPPTSVHRHRSTFSQEFGNIY